MKIAVTFASLSGNTLTIATKIQSILEAKDHQTVLHDLLQTNPDTLKEFDLVFLGSSTYGDGELNPIASMFIDLASTSGHQCEHTPFAIFALGDSTYPHFAESGQLMVSEMTAFGAECLQPLLKIDSAKLDSSQQHIEEWVENILKQVS